MSSCTSLSFGMICFVVAFEFLYTLYFIIFLSNGSLINWKYTHFMSDSQ